MWTFGDVLHLGMEENTNAVKTSIIKVESVKTGEDNAPEGTRFIHTFSVMDAWGTGGIFGFYATPEQEREYNDGMARMAEMS